MRDCFNNYQVVVGTVMKKNQLYFECRCLKCGTSLTQEVGKKFFYDSVLVPSKSAKKLIREYQIYCRLYHQTSMDPLFQEQIFDRFCKEIPSFHQNRYEEEKNQVKMMELVKVKK